MDHEIDVRKGRRTLEVNHHVGCGSAMCFNAHIGVHAAITGEGGLGDNLVFVNRSVQGDRDVGNQI